MIQSYPSFFPSKFSPITFVTHRSWNFDNRWKTSAKRYLPDYCLSLLEREACCCCYVFAFFAVPSLRNRHVRRKERTTKEVAGKPVSPSPGGTLGSGRGPSRCPSFKNSQAKIQSGVPCPAPRLTVCLLSAPGLGAWAPNRDLGAPRPRTLFPPSFSSRSLAPFTIQL